MKEKTLFKVRFNQKGHKDGLEVLVRSVEASHLPGMICLSDFVFLDNKKMIILPEEDAAAKRFRGTQTLHLPYHQIESVEEIVEEPIAVQSLPFIKVLPDETQPQVPHS